MFDSLFALHFILSRILGPRSNLVTLIVRINWLLPSVLLTLVSNNKMTLSQAGQLFLRSVFKHSSFVSHHVSAK